MWYAALSRHICVHARARAHVCVRTHNRFIRKDRERYDRVWKEMTQDRANVRQIQQLTSDVNAWKQENVIGGSNDGKRNSRPSGVTVVSSNGNGHSINNNDGLLEQRPQAESSPFGYVNVHTRDRRIVTSCFIYLFHQVLFIFIFLKTKKKYHP